MKKLLFMVLFLHTSLWADLALEKEGLYISSDCNVSFSIEYNRYKNAFVYSIGGIQNANEYKLNPTSNGMIFTKHFYYENEKKKGNIFAPINSETTFTIQNLWDNSSKVAFKGCPKFLNYRYVDSLAMIEKEMKSLKIKHGLNSNFIRSLVEKFPLRKSNVTAYNNLAYHLEKKGAYYEALILLRMITKRFPNRTVAHLNYADNIVKLKKSNKKDYSYKLIDAKHHYLTYITQMLKQKKGSKIPINLQVKYEKYWNFVKVLNKKIKQNYQILYVAEGDLNADSKKDLSVVIEYTDLSKIENTSHIWERPSNKNERVWLVFLAKNKSYYLFRKNKWIIEADEYTNCDDNFDSIRIKGKSLFLDTHFWCSLGGWEQGTEVYQFIYRDNSLILAGSEAQWTHRASAKGEMTSTNFLSKKMRVQATIEFGIPDGKAKWSTLKIDKPIQFEEYMNKHD